MLLLLGVENILSISKWIWMDLKILDIGFGFGFLDLGVWMEVGFVDSDLGFVGLVISKKY